MRLLNHTSTRAVGLALLTGLWAAACVPSKDNTTGNGGSTAKGGSASSSTSTPTGGTTATSSAQTGGATSNPTGGTTATSSAQTGGTTSNPTGGTTATSSAQTGGATSPGGTTTAGGGAGTGGSSSGGAEVGGSSSGGAGVGGSSSGGAAVGGSSSGGAGVGGTTSQTGGGTSAGGTTSAGGSIAGSTSASYAACTTDAGVVTGNACAPNSPIFAIDANCTLGLWASDGISSGYFYQPWCNNATTTCTLTMACATNSMHIAGSYLGASTSTMDGNAGLGANLQVNSSDAGPGCQMIDASGLTGLTMDVNVTTIPAGNHLYVGMTLANGNSADGTAVLTTGAQTVKIPWASFKNKLLCGSIPGPGVTSFYIAFDWFNDAVTHAVDVTISNFGFY